MLELTNVELFLPSGGDGTEPERSIPLLFVGSLERCGEHTLGWYIDGDTVGQRIVACPGVCERIQADPWSALVVLTGCGREGLPGEEPTLLPEPVCPAARPPSCSDATGGVAWVQPRCQRLGDDTVGSMDPLLTNVIVVAEGSPALAGYVPYLRSATECATVGDGWYYDEGVEPPRPSVCPETCACLRSTPGAHFMVETGCARFERR